MDVAADLDWRRNLHEHGLLHEDGLDGADESKDVGLSQLDEFAGLGGAHLQQGVDYLVNVHFHLLLHQQLKYIGNANNNPQQDHCSQLDKSQPI